MEDSNSAFGKGTCKPRPKGEKVRDIQRKEILVGGRKGKSQGPVVGKSLASHWDIVAHGTGA